MAIITGSIERGLQLVTDVQDPLSTFARSAFFKAALRAERRLGCKQFVIVATGCDAFAMQNKDERLCVLAQDSPDALIDAVQTMEESGFSRNKKSFFGLLGTSLCFSKSEFKDLLKAVGRIMCEGSAVCFDYPSGDDGWETQTDYSYVELETMLEECGFLIYEHLDYDTCRLVYGLEMPKGICYVHAVTKGDTPFCTD